MVGLVSMRSKLPLISEFANTLNCILWQVARNKPTTPNVTKAVKQFEAMFKYTSALRYQSNK